MSNTERQLEALLNDETANVPTISRIDKYLKACCEKCGCAGLPTPISREDELLYQLADKMASAVEAEAKTITENGVYTAPQGKAYTPVTVNVPQAEPIEISTEQAMTALLVAANVGKAYKYTGTTGTYTNGDIYIVQEES